MAIDAAGQHMSPEIAAELHDLRTRLAAVANPPREVFLALYDGAEPELFTTVEAARECCDDLAKTVAELEGRGVEFTDEVSDRGYGLVIHFKMPGGFEGELYQPRYEMKRQG